MNNAPVIVLDETHVAAAISVLVSAFLGDPIFNYYFPDRSVRQKVFELFFDDIIRGQISAECAFATADGADLSAVAVWMPPDPPEPTLTDRQRSERAIEQLHALDRRAIDAVLAGFEGLQAHHPREPHWYLMFIGVNPHLQRGGLGRLLLTPTHQRADRAGTKCYLETPFPETRAFYGKLGYRVVREMRAFGDAPPLWTMLREPGSGRHLAV
jgi:GNAT superfamily N-acetyltransferase